MTLQAQQIVSLATQIARVPGFTAQAGQLLNLILSDLCQTYDLAINLTTTTVTLVSQSGSGPYALPDNYLRMAKNEVVYDVNGAQYVMISIDLSEYDALDQNPGINNYPEYFATDTSASPPSLFVWPPPSGAFVVTIRYFQQRADIVTPQSSTTVPWFPNTDYLVTRLAGELMKITDDARAPAFLDEGATGAQGILKRFLKLQADDNGRAKTVTLDRRRFGSPYSKAPDTKKIGWS
jgi:hypothetical protein